MKVIVCGGRDYQDRDAVFAALDKAHAKRPFEMVIHGGARGADTLAGQWAELRGIFSARVDALWDAHGRAAGYRRNRAMLELFPEGVIAFPGGRGTADMVRAAREAGVKVWCPYGEGG